MPSRPPSRKPAPASENKPAPKSEGAAPKPLAGKTALVTGGAVRVGRAIALALGAAGARVAVHHHKSRPAAERLVAQMHARGMDAESFSADLGSLDGPGHLVARVERWAQGLDLLVNNAAVFQQTPFEQVTPESLEGLWNLNFRGPFLLCQAATPALRRHKGAIVNILDVAAYHAWRGYSHYCPTKAALAMLTRNLAIELAPDVRVCGVAPGTVLFPEDFDEATKDRVVSRIPLAREGRPEDVADAVLYLATAAYVTGAVLPVDGGRMAGSRDPL
ncbi:MAG: SDR family oxidoreductase [Myxococcales bacterium]|nr:SDR family oxidoreductase [Myxococcales bacterium]